MSEKQPNNHGDRARKVFNSFADAGEFFLDKRILIPFNIALGLAIAVSGYGAVIKTGPFTYNGKSPDGSAWAISLGQDDYASSGHLRLDYAKEGPCLPDQHSPTGKSISINIKSLSTSTGYTTPGLMTDC